MEILVWLLAAGLALWLAALIANLLYNRSALIISSRMEFPLSEHPKVSILIPARNEAKNLSLTLPGLLAQEYPNYEVILADDASTDETAILAEEYSRKHPGKLKVVRISSLPENWNGKIHALHQAMNAASGEWLIATDADIVFHPKALRAGLWIAARERAELVTIYAYLECITFWERLLLPGFWFMLATLFPIGKINNPTSSVALASGGYILMRRKTWQQLGGYQAIQSEMIDDLNTARLIKHSGNRIYAAVTKDLIRTRMYQSLAGIWEGLRKNSFAGSRYSIVRHCIVVAVDLLCNLLPLVCLTYIGWNFATNNTMGTLKNVAGYLSLAQYLLSVMMHLPVIVFYRIPIFYALLVPIGALIYGVISMDSMLRTLLGRGVSWKSRKYGKSTVVSNR